MRVTQPPTIGFKCRSCGAQNEGEEHEFIEQNTMPPTWKAICGFCRSYNFVSPTALIAKLVSTYFP